MKNKLFLCITCASPYILIKGKKYILQNKKDNLLVEICNIIQSNNIDLESLNSIEVCRDKGTFTQERISVAIINALGATLGKNVNYLGQKPSKFITPQYSGNPSITKSKKLSV